MEDDLRDQPDERPTGAEPVTVGLLRRQTAEACAHVREQAARIHAGLPPDPRPPSLQEAAGKD
jgi:hypothetical protein